MNIIQRVIGVLGVAALLFLVFIHPPLQTNTGLDAYQVCGGYIRASLVNSCLKEFGSFNVKPLAVQGITIIVCTVGLVMLASGKLPRRAKH